MRLPMSAAASPLRRSHARVFVGVQLLALVVLAVMTGQRFHVWAAVDEVQHYDYVQTIAEDDRLPEIRDPIHPEIPRNPATAGLGSYSYEAFQPPLYYLLAVPAFSVPDDYETKLRAVRQFDAVLLLLAAGVVFLLARAVLPQRPLLGFAAGLGVLLWPGVVARAVTISPSALELLVVNALLLALWRVQQGAGRRWLAAAGALTGAALLTKTTLIYVVPLVALVLALDWRRRRDTRALAVAAVLPVLMLAPWLAFNHHHYGSWTASAQARELQRSTVNPNHRDYGLAEVGSFTRRLFDNVLPTEWAGQLDAGWVQAAVLALDLLLFGAWVVLVCLRRRGPPARALWFFGLPVLVGYASLVVVLLAEQWPSFNLRYLYAVLPGLAISVVAAMPERRAWWLVGASALLAAALWVDMAGAFYFKDVGNALGI
jgi:4-amino-4-deoxy-L-arabinose transferase-like glycosyltransferase